MEEGHENVLRQDTENVLRQDTGSVMRQDTENPRGYIFACSR